LLTQSYPKTPFKLFQKVFWPIFESIEFKFLPFFIIKSLVWSKNWSNCKWGKQNKKWENNYEEYILKIDHILSWLILWIINCIQRICLNAVWRNKPSVDLLLIIVHETEKLKIHKGDVKWVIKTPQIVLIFKWAKTKEVKHLHEINHSPERFIISPQNDNCR